MDSSAYLRVMMVLFTVVLSSLCITESVEEAPSTTTTIEETTTLPSTTTSLFTSTTRRRNYSSITLPSATTSSTEPSVVDVTIPVIPTLPKKELGEQCIMGDECKSGYCPDEVCCSKGQCGFGKKCVNTGYNRSDGKTCRNGDWKGTYGARCGTDDECTTGNCRNNYCCYSNECGYGMDVKRCYSLNQVRPDMEMVCGKYNGTVMWLNADAQPCEEDKECGSQNCIDDHCCPDDYCYSEDLEKCYESGRKVKDKVCDSGVWEEREEDEE